MALVLAIATPAVAALLIAVAASALPRRACAVAATAATAGSFAAALAYALTMGSAPAALRIAPWLPLRGADIVLRLEPSLALVLVAVTGVAAVAFAASLAAPCRPSTYAAGLVMLSADAALCAADGLLFAFAAWEIGAVAMYVLLAERSDRPRAADGARAFLAVTRSTDVAALVGIFGILAVFHSVDLGEVRARAALGGLIPSALEALRWSFGALALAALARAGQLPFSRWLASIDAPALTRVLILAVAAPSGIVLLLRLAPIAPVPALVVAGAVGAATAVLAAAVALGEPAEARALAWGAVARSGVIMVALALSPPAAAGLLVLHAVSQAALVLGASAPAGRLSRAVTVLASLADLAFVVTAPLAARRIATALRSAGGAPSEVAVDALDETRAERVLASAGRLVDSVLAAATRPLALGTERLLARPSEAPALAARATRAARTLSTLPEPASSLLLAAVVAALVAFWVLA